MQLTHLNYPNYPDYCTIHSSTIQWGPVEQQMDA